MGAEIQKWGGKGRRREEEERGGDSGGREYGRVGERRQDHKEGRDDQRGKDEEKE